MYHLASFAFSKAIRSVPSWHALAALLDEDFCACVLGVCWGGQRGQDFRVGDVHPLLTPVSVAILCICCSFHF